MSDDVCSAKANLFLQIISLFADYCKDYLLQK